MLNKEEKKKQENMHVALFKNTTDLYTVCVVVQYERSVDNIYGPYLWTTEVNKKKKRMFWYVLRLINVAFYFSL